MMRFRLVRRVTLFLAVLPLFQGLGACGTGINQVLGNVTNSLPALNYNAAQSVFLLPYQIGLALATGGFGSSSTGGSGGLGGSGGFGSSGLGGSSGI